MNNLFLFICLAAGLGSSAQNGKAVNKTLDSAHTYFGVKYPDPYCWMENMKSPEVVSWFKLQADGTNSILSRIPGRDSLIAEWKMLDRLSQPVIEDRVYMNGRLFYKKSMPGENVARLYFRTGMNGKEVLLFDPTTFIPGKTLTIQELLPSYDGKMVVIAYSEGGHEISTIRIMEVDTRRFLPEAIYPSWFGPIAWTFDNKSFTYSVQRSGDNTSMDMELNSKTKLHRLGENVKNDPDFFSNESYPGLNIKPNDLPFAGTVESSPGYVFANLFNVRPEYYSYYAPVSEFNSGKIAWKVLCLPEDQLVRSREIVGNDVYAITCRNARHYKLIHTSLLHPDWGKADVIAAEDPALTLESIRHCKDYLLMTYSDGINNHLFRYAFATRKTDEVKLPRTGTVTVFCLDKNSNNCNIGIVSWNQPASEYNLNAATGELTLGTDNQAPVYPEAYRNLQVEEVQVKGHDGTMIPLTIIYRKGLKKDGANACLMDGYGAYGISLNSYFYSRENTLATKGVVIAVAHVRGGSEKGEDWYRAGYKTTKPNAWKDFNSCAEYLIANGYTSASKMAGTGTSAGGILISRAITERPDLYAAAICNVGCANAMRAEFSPNGPGNIPEFGTVNDSTECRALFEMDGVLHVQKGVKYPAVLGVAGWNDPRVIAWQPGKFIAALQDASVSGKPVLMKVNYNNGHFTEDKAEKFAGFADQFAFAMWQCGHPDFQMKK